ncbi:hypothetical protein AMTRI_Chr13g92940 [Amborella trichopoda]
MSIFDAIKQVVHLHGKRRIKRVASPTCTSYFLAFNNRRHRYIYQRVMEGPFAATWRTCSCAHNNKLRQLWRLGCSSISGLFSALLQETWLLAVQTYHARYAAHSSRA